MLAAKHRIRFAGQHTSACAQASLHRRWQLPAAHCFADLSRDLQVKPLPGSVRINAIKKLFRPRQARPHAAPIPPLPAQSACGHHERKTSQRSGAAFFASMETTMHWLPNFSAPERIKSGFAIAEELNADLVGSSSQHVIHVFDRT